MAKTGRPKGRTAKQRAALRYMSEGMAPREAYAAAGFADPKREAERQARVSDDLREAAVEAHAELVTTPATVMSGSQMNAVKRLTSVIAYGEDRDAISAARAMHVIAPDVDSKEQLATTLVTFISIFNGRGPAYGTAAEGGGSNQIRISCDLADRDRVLELLQQAVRDAQRGLKLHVIELRGMGEAHADRAKCDAGFAEQPQPIAAAEPEPMPSTVPPPKRKAEPIIPPAPPKPTRTAEEILAHYRSITP